MNFGYYGPGMFGPGFSWAPLGAVPPVGGVGCGFGLGYPGLYGLGLGYPGLYGKGLYGAGLGGLPWTWSTAGAGVRCSCATNTGAI